MADGAISMFEDVYHFYHWRPITALNKNNPIPKWEPLKRTPSVPEYPSTPAILGAATGNILQSIFSDTVSVNVPTGPPTINYITISQAVNDNAMTKINCGVNFRKSSEDSMIQGERIGRFVYENEFLKIFPAKSKPKPSKQKAARIK
jgi:hypothetical protein